MLIILTIASTLLALLMSVVAWRASRAERLRSDARVEALARDIHASANGDDLPLRPAIGRAAIESTASSGIFAAAAEPAPSGSRWGLALAVGAFGIAAAAAIVVVLGGGDAPGTRVAIASATEQSAVATRPAPTPLELVTLSHDRDGNQLTVRGVVRNPASGIEMDRLTAVVVLLNRDGDALATGRAPVAAPALIPGGESTFAVTLAETGDVSRYRVSFREGERVVPHVDRRTQP